MFMKGCKMYKTKKGDVYLFEIYDDYIALYVNNGLREKKAYKGSMIRAIKEMIQNDGEEIKKVVDKYCV